MNTHSTNPKVEHLLYAGIFFLALFLRGLKLGALPLSDAEAELALNALEIANGSATTVQPHPLYVLSTSFLFFLLGASTTIARILPVLVGSALTLLPFFHRERFGRSVALLVAVGLALNPTLITASRVVGSPMLALAGVLFLLTAWTRGWARWVGIGFAFTLLAGPSGFFGIVWLLVLAVGAYALRVERVITSFSFAQETMKQALLSFGVTLVLAATLFLRVPQGVGGLADALPMYLSGWGLSSGVPSAQMWGAFFFPQPLILIFGLIFAGMLLWKQHKLAYFLLFSIVISVLLVLAYPARQPLDWVWSIVPLIISTAFFVAPFADRAVLRDIPALSLIGGVLVFLSSFWINLAGLLQYLGTQDVQRLIVIGGAIMLLVLSVLLVGLGWSTRSAQRGLVWGTVLFLGVYSLGMVGSVEYQSGSRSSDIWRTSPRTADLTLLRDTVFDLSEWETGRSDALDVALQIDSPALVWALREMPNLLASDSIPTNDAPAITLTPESEPAGALASAYRGQDFDWQVYPQWEAMNSTDWLRWMVLRDTPSASSRVIVWARIDLFPEENPDS